MKRMFGLLFALALVAASCGDSSDAAEQAAAAAGQAAAAAEQTAAEAAEEVSDALQALRSRGVVTANMFVEVPTSSIGTDGVPVGLVPELTAELFRRLGVDKFEGTALDFPAVIPSVQAGQYDFASSNFSITQERCDTVAFSDPIIANRLLYVVADGNPEGIVDLASMRDNGLTQAVASGTMQEGIANENDIGTVVVSAVPDMIAAVESGRADATVMSDLVATYLGLDERLDLVVAEEYPISFTSVIFARDNAGLRDDFNRELAAMGEDGTFAEFLETYGSNPDLVIGVTRQDILEGCY